MSVNGAFKSADGVTHDTIDTLEACMRCFFMMVNAIPGLFKVDVDSAFRRVPLMPAHRWAAGIVFRLRDRFVIANHVATPFGAASSNHSWDRVGRVIELIARRLLRIGILRYVDDFFAPERRETMQHAATCMTRLVRVLLGVAAVSDSKVEWGSILTILGVLVSPTGQGITFQPSPDKREKWIKIIRAALDVRQLWPGQASKLVGKLAWGSTKLFRKMSIVEADL
jgi:hypothetical protein